MVHVDYVFQLFKSHLQILLDVAGGQFGVCVINMEPLEEGAGVEFESRIKGKLLGCCCHE